MTDLRTRKRYRSNRPSDEDVHGKLELIDMRDFLNRY